MTPREKRAIIQTGNDILGEKFNTIEASILMAAIAYQESNFEYRKQIGGPARGLWQFEKGGGVHGVMNHRATKDHARRVCSIRRVSFDTESVYKRLAHDDVLAASFARLLLWTDPKPIPTHRDECWEYYIRNWRPGKPHPDRWQSSHSQALELY